MKLKDIKVGESYGVRRADNVPFRKATVLEIQRGRIADIWDPGTYRSHRGKTTKIIRVEVEQFFGEPKEDWKRPQDLITPWAEAEKCNAAREASKQARAKREREMQDMGEHLIAAMQARGFSVTPFNYNTNGFGNGIILTLGKEDVGKLLAMMEESPN
jgi:hypothetical protein